MRWSVASTTVAEARLYNGEMKLGLPVGLLLAFTTPAAELAPGGRVAEILLSIAVTMAWTIPFSFGTRWLALRSIDPLHRSE